MLGVALLLAAQSGCAHTAPAPAGPPQIGQATRAFHVSPTRPEEQFQLALRCESGDDVMADDAWAEYWAWRAALSGHVPAMDWLGRRAYAERIDRPWFVLFNGFRRVERAHPSAQLWLATAMRGRALTAESQREARNLILEALPIVRERALRADVWAKYLVGVVDDFAFDQPAEALRWYTEAAEHGHVLAQDSLGHMYQSGRGTAADSTKAAKWFQAAASQGYPPSMTMLGWLYDGGRGVPENPGEAVRWFTAAASQGYSVAQADLGVAYERGRGVAADPAQAASWYARAAEQGSAFAQNRLGSLYASGRGVARDEQQAARWFAAAAAAGSSDGAKNLRVLEARRKAAEAAPASPAGAPEPAPAEAEPASEPSSALVPAPRDRS